MKHFPIIHDGSPSDASAKSNKKKKPLFGSDDYAGLFFCGCGCLAMSAADLICGLTSVSDHAICPKLDIGILSVLGFYAYKGFFEKHNQ